MTPASSPNPNSGKTPTASTKLPTNLEFSDVMKLPLKIAPLGQGQNPTFDIIRQEDRAAAIEMLLDLSLKAPDRSIIRLAGGCKGFSADKVQGLFKYFAHGLVSGDGQRCFRGSVGSGGTLEYGKDGNETAMITQVPYYLARLFDCISWSSTPQTFRATLDANRSGSVILSKYGAHLDWRGHMNIVTQNSANSFQGWDGDVKLYMEALDQFAKHGFKVAVGVVNGGDVTMDETLMAIAKGIPVIIVKGSDRAADQLAKAIEAENSEAAVADLYAQAYKRNLLNPDKEVPPSAAQIHRLAYLVDFNDPKTLSEVMDRLGLLS